MTETRTTCPYCGVGCGVIASVSDDGVSVRGDESHPANAGRLCVKGAALGETTGLAGRLLYPEVDDRRCDWPEAIGEASRRLQAIIAQHGPQAVAFYTSGQLLTEDYYAANKLMKGFIGAANIDTNSRLCMSSAVTGYKRALGADVVPCGYEDVEQADLVVIVGSNIAWAHPVLYQRLQQAKRDNPALQVVVIDPRRTASCDIADQHLALAPDSDTALFVGLLNAIVQQGATVSQFSDAPQALATAAGWTVERVAASCGLDVEEVNAFWQRFLSASRVVTLYTMGVNQSVVGSDKCNAIINVHLASGHYDRPGCGPFSLTGQPNAMGGREVGALATMLAAHMGFEADDLSRLARFWGSERLAQTPGLPAVELFAAIGRGEVKAVWIMGTNPAVSLPDSHAVCQALAACPLVIVSEVAAQTDTSRYAHIRFPALAWGEKSGTVTNSERRLSRQRAFLPAPGEARADWWVVAQMATALGHGAAFRWQHAHDVFREHAALSGFENQGQRAFDISALAALSREQWEAMTPQRWPLTTEGRALALGQGWHGDGRLRLVPVTPAPPAVQTGPLYPYLLNSGRIRDQWHTMTRTGTVPRLMQHIDRPIVEIAPSDAQRSGVGDGMLARISTPRGVMVAQVRVTAGQRAGSLFVPMHWNDHFARQAKVNNLLAARCDPHSGQPAFKHTAARIAPWQPDWQGELVARCALPIPPAVWWARKALSGLQHLILAADGSREWIRDYCLAQDWQLQESRTDSTQALLAWHRGALMLGFWSGRRSPEVDTVAVAAAFAAPPEDPAIRHRLLAGRAAEAGLPPGRIVCSCFSVGENAIAAAIADGCASTMALGQRLKCGTNCGSCLPELRAMLTAACQECS